MSVFTMKAMGKIEEYIDIDTEFSDIQEYCRKSAVQFLNREKIILGTLDSGGIEFPDLIVKGDVWLFSDYIIQNIRADIEDYVFLKYVEIICNVIGKKEKYWIIVPPRIDCLDLDKSTIIYDWDFELGIIPVLQSKKTVISEKLTGYYQIFKVLGIDDGSIFIKEELVKRISNLNPEGIKFVKC